MNTIKTLITIISLTTNICFAESASDQFSNTISQIWLQNNGADATTRNNIERHWEINALIDEEKRQDSEHDEE